MFSSWKIKSQRFYIFYFSVIIFGNSATYWLEMAVLISLEGILTQRRIGICWVALPSKRPMKGKYICFMEKFFL